MLDPSLDAQLEPLLDELAIVFGLADQQVGLGQHPRRVLRLEHAQPLVDLDRVFQIARRSMRDCHQVERVDVIGLFAQHLLGDLQRVVSNLAQNAVEASPAGAVITIASSAETGDGTQQYAIKKLGDWSRETVLQFYADLAESPADTIVLGETVCARRRELRLEDWLALGRELRAAGKDVVLAAQALIETEADLRLLERQAEQQEFAVEAADASALQLLAAVDLAGLGRRLSR